MTIEEQCKQAGISRTTYYWRKKHGLPLYDEPTPRSMRTKNRYDKVVLQYNNEWLTIAEIMKIEDKPYSSIYRRYVINEKTKLPRRNG